MSKSLKSLENHLRQKFVTEGMQSQGSQSERKKEVNHAKGEHKCKRVCNQAGYSTGQSLRICPQSENTEPWKKLWGLTIQGGRTMNLLASSCLLPRGPGRALCPVGSCSLRGNLGSESGTVAPASTSISACPPSSWQRCWVRRTGHWTAASLLVSCHPKQVASPSEPWSPPLLRWE